MIYTEKELVNLHKCSVYKIDALTYLNEDLIVDIGIGTNSMVTTNRPQDFSYGVISPRGLEYFGRSQDELNQSGAEFLMERLHPETARRIIPALTSFYNIKDQNNVFTDIQVARRDISAEYAPFLTSSKISKNGNFLTFNIPIKELGSLGNKIQRELEISKKFQQMLPQFHTLSKREKEILRLIGHGLTNKEIGDRLICTSHTARTHRMNIYRKLSIYKLKEAIDWAITFNLI